MNKKKTKKDYTNEEVIAGLQLKDDILFSAVFEDLGAAQELVRTVLDDETIILKEAKTQYDIANVRGHSVRLDMYGESTKGHLHNVEVQIHYRDVPKERRVEYLRKRAFYNASLIAGMKFEKSENYLNMDDIYIVFLLEDDEFGTNKTVEYITEHLASTNEQIESFVHYIFINSGVMDETKISHLMEMFNDSSKYNEEFKQIAEVTNRIKYIEGGQSIMGKTVFEEWKEQLIEEGREETTIEYFKDGFIPAEKAAEKLGMSVDEFLEKYGK
jgi:hypothetical protein